MPSARAIKPKNAQPRALQPSRIRGQIIQKDDRKWLVRFFIERDQRTGKRRYAAVTVDGTRREAHRELTKRLAELDAGGYRVPSKLTLESYLRDQWLAERAVDVRTGAMAQRTLDDYRRAVNKIAPLLGARSLDLISKRDVADLKRELTERYQVVAAQRAFDVFRMAMKRAFSLDIIAVNPAPAESRIKAPKPETAALDGEQLAHFLTTAETYRHGRYAAIFHVLLLGGLRPSEALALRWSDLEGATLRVASAVTSDTLGRRVIGKTKTRTVRSVSLPVPVLKALRRHDRWQREGMGKGGGRRTWEDGGRLMFPDEQGALLRIERVRTAWNAIIRNAGLPKLRLYDARHSYVSALLHQGVDVRTVADLAGHSDPAMTLRRYAHTSPASKQGAADKLSAAFASMLALVA